VKLARPALPLLRRKKEKKKSTKKQQMFYLPLGKIFIYSYCFCIEND